MTLADFDYELDPSFIATNPLENRSDSKLMVLDRKKLTSQISDFSLLQTFLPKNSVLIFNEVKVQKCRVVATRDNGKEIEIFILDSLSPTTFTALLRNAPVVRSILSLPGGSNVRIIDKSDSFYTLEMVEDFDLYELMEKYGNTPLPPYIKPTAETKDDRYQTIYHNPNKTNAKAAPTAGLHFTDKLLSQLQDTGVSLEYLTLDVGLGTFQNLRHQTVSDNSLHSEKYEISDEVANRLNSYREQGKKLIAVGTTSLRALESNYSGVHFKGGSFDTSAFFYPPYKFQSVDGLITNFHLPRSSLLMLVSAFCSYPNSNEKFETFAHSFLGKSYEKAKDSKFRFFSFGDACLII